MLDWTSNRFISRNCEAKGVTASVCQVIQRLLLFAFLNLFSAFNGYCQELLFLENFNGPALSTNWIDSLPDGKKLTNDLPHSILFTDIEGHSVIHSFELLGAGEGRGWGTKEVFHITNFVAEVRFRGLSDRVAPGYHPAVRLWLIDAEDPSKFLSFLTFRTGTGFGFKYDDSVGGKSSESSSYLNGATNHRWLRLTMEGARGRPIKIGLNTDQGDQLYEAYFPYYAALFPQGFRLGLSYEVGEPGSSKYTGFHVDRVSLRSTPLDPTSTFHLETWRGAQEGAAHALIDVVRTGDLIEEVSVKYETKAETARPGEHYQDVAGMLVFSSGVSTQQIKVPLLNDGLPKSSKSFSVRLQSESELALIGPRGQASISISDNDLGYHMFISQPSFLKEGDSSGEITIVRGNDLKAETSVDLVVEGQTASAVEDYLLGSTRLHFASGESIKKLKLEIVDDLLVESAELLDVTLANPSAGTGLASFSTSVHITISDNDHGSILHHPRGDEYFGIDVTFQRTDGLQHAVSVSYETKDLTAQAGTDYMHSSGTITFEKGQSFQTIHIPTIDNDRTNLPDRQFRLDVKSGSPHVTGGTFVVNLPDDEPVRFTVEGFDGPVTEGQQRRIRIWRSGELVGTNSYLLRYQFTTNSSCSDIPGKDTSLAEFELVFGPEEREKWQELNFPDNTHVDTSERCASLSIVRVQNGSELPLWTSNIRILDNEVAHSVGVTLPLVRGDQPLEFVPLPDGSAFVLGVPASSSGQSAPTIRRIGSDLRLDNTFRPAVPADVVISKMVADRAGRLIVAGNKTDGSPLLLKIERGGNLEPFFQPKLPINKITALKVDGEGRLYVAGTNQIVRLLPTGALDPLFKKTTYQGEAQKLWIEESGVYVGVHFQAAEGMSNTNSALVRLERDGGIDSSFKLNVQPQDGSVLDLMTLTNGNLLVHCFPKATLLSPSGSKLAEYDMARWGCFGMSCWERDWDHHVRTSNGRMFTLQSVNDRYSSLYRLAPFKLEMDAIVSGSNLPISAWPLGLYAGGDYLWLAELEPITIFQTSNLKFRRFAFMETNQESFGIGETAFGPKSLGDQPLFVIQRAGNSSRPATVQYTIKQINLHTRQEQTVQSGAVVFESNQVAGPVFLDSHLAETSQPLNMFGISIEYPQSVEIGGTTYAKVLIAGKQPVGEAEWYCYPSGTIVDGGPPMFVLTGRNGYYTIESSDDLRIWEPLTSLILSTAYPSHIFNPYMDGTNSRRFYRVVPLPPM